MAAELMNRLVPDELELRRLGCVMQPSLRTAYRDRRPSKGIANWLSARFHARMSMVHFFWAFISASVADQAVGVERRA